MSTSYLRLVALATLAFAWVEWPVYAQSPETGSFLTSPTGESELRGRQAELFNQLFDEPDNLELMFEYAQVSIQVEDYEAAISTLERMLIYNQDLNRVRLELGVAYFSLGSYAVAKLYFDQVANDPETPPTVLEKIARFTDEINQRTQRHALSLVTTVGITHATNATQGPDTNQILFGGNINTLLTGQSEADTGLRVTLNLTHKYDLAQADDDFFQTDFSLYSLRFFDSDEGNLIFGRVRTGPRLSLDRRQFGPKIRPYVEGQYLHSQERGLFSAFGAGLEYNNTLNPVLSVFSDAGLRYTNYFRSEFSDEDRYSVYGSLGFAYLPRRDLILRTTLLGELESADADQNSNQEIGLRLSGQHLYDTGFNWVDERWSFSAFVEGRARFFEEPELIVDPATKRRDFDVRAGLSHVFAIREGFGIQADIEGLVRDSNVVNFDLDNLSATLSLQYRM